MSDRQDGGPIRNLYALVCPWVQGKSSPPSTSPVLCVDVPGVSGSEPKVRPANACWPAFSLRDWRLLSPGVLGEGSLGRLGGVVGLAWGAMPPGLSASRTGPARQRMAAARPCTICSGNRLRSSFSPLNCDPWLQRRSCQWWRGRSVDNAVDFTTTWPRWHSSNLMSPRDPDR